MRFEELRSQHPGASSGPGDAEVFNAIINDSTTKHKKVDSLSFNFNDSPPASLKIVGVNLSAYFFAAGAALWNSILIPNYDGLDISTCSWMLTDVETNT